jgi:putative ABC transport system permease protein
VSPRGATDYPAVPRLARWCLALRVPRAEREFVAGDLEEGFQAIHAASGFWSARFWYWRQVWSMLRTSWGKAARRQPINGGTSMSSWLPDIRAAARSLRRAPLFSALVILTLTIGIGATSALFSALYPVVLADPPFSDSDRLVMIWERGPNGEKNNLGFPTGDDIRRETRSFSSVAMTAGWGPTLHVEGAVEQVNGARVSHEYFSTLGVRPRMGRDFRPEEDTPGTRRVVILSDALWRRSFASDSTIVSRTVTINATSYVVAGVMPPDYHDLIRPQAQIWTPLGYEGSAPPACRTCQHLTAVARLRDGVPHAAALQEVDAFFRTLRERHPTQYASTGAFLPTLKAEVTGDVRAPLLSLFSAVLVLMLLASTNVANLFLGRAGERQGELAIRLALGAERGRLVRMVALESVILAAAGGALGLLVAALGTRVLLDVMAVPAALAARVQMTPPVALFALLVTSLSAVIGAALPAALALGESALTDVRMGTRAVVGRVRHRMRNAIVVAEVALAGLLLAGAGIQVRTLQRVLAVDTGFDPAGVLTMQLYVLGPRYEEDGASRRYYRQLVDRLASLPGVEGAAVASQLPLGGNFDGSGLTREDVPTANPEDVPGVQRFAVSTTFLEVMGIGVLRGRGFTPTDREGSLPVVLINRSAAERLYGSTDPIGRRVQINGSHTPWRTIVGIVEDVRHLSMEGAVENQLYLPFDQHSWEEPALTLVTRVTGSQAIAERTVAAAARELDPGVALSGVLSMNQVIGRSVAPRRLALSLVTGFAIIAIILAVGGLYGVMAASVTERVREIGVRAALGATPGRLVRRVVGNGLVLTSIGAAIGLALFLAAGRIIDRFVYGVAASDPVTLAGVALLLVAVALLASFVPAVRAARADPLVTLRE